jgi:hypothetical protein
MDFSNKRRHSSRVAIICQLDRYANRVRPLELQRFLRDRGHDVHLVDTYHLGRASSDIRSRANKLPGRGVGRTALYAVEAAARLSRGSPRLCRRLSYHLLRADCRIRRDVIRSLVSLDDYDAVICETPHDAEVLTVETSARTIYDCPTPWADELYYEGRLTPRQHERMRQYESELLERVDVLAFWWETYAEYAVEKYGLTGSNLITLNFGCRPAARRADFRNPPRIVYLGSLSSRFIDLPLLARLTKAYPHIDVYGAPAPDAALGLNYRGYAPASVLQGYQVGLITSTRDELRQYGFSAKHLEYLAYGLPVLVPAWRRRLDLLRGSVPYDEETFVDVVASLASEAAWHRASDNAYAQAIELSWDRTLEPLDHLLRESPQRR